MSSNDQYRSFRELARHEKEGRDYRWHLELRDSNIAIFAPHGGGIEPGTSELARALAGEDFSLYLFEALNEEASQRMHVTSTRWDEPNGLDLASRSQTIVTVHGCLGKHRKAWVGGLHQELRVRAIGALEQAGIPAADDNSHHSGCHPDNICNRGLSGMGLQLELTEGLRRSMFAGFQREQRQYRSELFNLFVAALRSVLLTVEKEAV